MKRLGIFSIICVLVMSANQVVALTYEDPFPFQVGRSTLSESRISEAKLLQSYVLRYQSKIQILYEKYHKEESTIMRNTHITLESMSLALKRIQEGTILEKDAIKIMQSIVKDLKILNVRMKIYLEQEKFIFEEKINIIQRKYNSLGIKISNILDAIIENFSLSFAKKKILNEKEKDIIRALLIIREENNKIKIFQNTSFSSEVEMKAYFKRIISNIRKQMLIIKGLSS